MVNIKTQLLSHSIYRWVHQIGMYVNREAYKTRTVCPFTS